MGALDGPWLNWIVLAIADLAAKSLVLAALCLLIYRRLGKASASLRHSLLLILFGGILLLPLLSGMSRTWKASYRPPLPEPVLSRMEQRDSGSHPQLATAAVLDRHQPIANPSARTIAAAPPTAPTAAPAENPARDANVAVKLTASQPSRFILIDGILLIWLSGVIAMVAWHLWGILWLRRKVLAATPLADTSHNRDLQESCRRMGLQGAPRLVKSHSIPSPFVWGLFKPVIVLKPDFARLPQEHRQLMLMHEMGHILRMDLWSRRIARAACCLCWFNPLMWIAERCLVIEQERACDDLVVKRGAKAPEYAQMLLDAALGTSFVSLQSPASSFLVRFTLKERLFALIDRPSRQADCSPVGRLASIAVPVAAVILLAMLSPQLAKPSPMRSETEVRAVKRAGAQLGVLPALPAEPPHQGKFMLTSTTELPRSPASIQPFSPSLPGPKRLAPRQWGWLPLPTGSPALEPESAIGWFFAPDGVQSANWSASRRFYAAALLAGFPSSEATGFAAPAAGRLAGLNDPLNPPPDSAASNQPENAQHPDPAAEPEQAPLLQVEISRTEISGLDGLMSARDINNKGAVVGNQIAPPVFHAFFWTPQGGAIEIGSPAGWNVSGAYRINDRNQVLLLAGSPTSPSLSLTALFVWSQEDGFQSVETPGGCLHPMPVDLNEESQVLGTCLDGVALRTFVWSALEGSRDIGDFLYLAEPGSLHWTEGADLNDFGEVTGTSDNLAFYWSSATGMLPILPAGEAVPAHESRASFALSINNAGQVVGGMADFDDEFTANQPFAWHPEDGLIMLQRPPEATSNSSFALAINDSGQIIGRRLERVESEIWSLSVFWDAQGRVTDVKSSQSATEFFDDPLQRQRLNSLGHFVGQHQDSTSGQEWKYAYLWRPDTGLVNLGPESRSVVSKAVAVNDAGQAIGWESRKAPNRWETQAILWEVFVTPVFLPEPGDGAPRRPGRTGAERVQ